MRRMGVTGTTDRIGKQTEEEMIALVKMGKWIAKNRVLILLLGILLIIPSFTE